MISRTIAKFILLFLPVASAITACNRKKITLDIPSSFHGYVYIVSANGLTNEKTIRLDSSGIVYINGYCNGDILLDITMDDKPIHAEWSYEETSFVSGNQNGIDYSVNFKTFYFPFEAKKSITHKPASIKELILAGKIDPNRLKSCE